MTTLALLSHPLWQALAVTLLHFVWQGALVAVLLWATLAALRSSRQRHLAALVALVAIIAAPIGTMLYVVSHSSPHATQADLLLEATDLAQLTALDIDTTRTWSSFFSHLLAIAQPYVILAWLAGVIGLAMRLLVSYIGIWRWRTTSQPLDNKLLPVFCHLARRMHVSGRVRAASSNLVREALVIGLFRPLVLIPAAWITEMPAATLEAVLAHELAHIRRHDLWINLVQRLVEMLLFYHPAVWYVSGVLRVEREKCCDELAVAATGERLIYAEALQLVAHRRLAASPSMWAATLGGSKTMNLLERVRNVLGQRPDGSAARYWPVGLAALVLPVGLWCAAAALAPPAQADDEPAAEKTADQEARTIDEFIRAALDKGLADKQVDYDIFLRRVLLDTEGRVPTEAEMKKLHSMSDEEARAYVREFGVVLDDEGEGKKDGDKEKLDKPKKDEAKKDKPVKVKVTKDGDAPRDGDKRPDFDVKRDAPRDGDKPRAGDREQPKREADRDVPKKEGDRPAVRREGDREVPKKEGDRPVVRREGDREVPKAGDREQPKREADREVPKKEGDRPVVRREGDRELPKREGDRLIIRREGDRAPEAGNERERELIRTIEALRQEMQQLRREVNELREREKPKGDASWERLDAQRKQLQAERQDLLRMTERLQVERAKAEQQKAQAEERYKKATAEEYRRELDKNELGGARERLEKQDLELQESKVKAKAEVRELEKQLKSLKDGDGEKAEAIKRQINDQIRKLQSDEQRVLEIRKARISEKEPAKEGNEKLLEASRKDLQQKIQALEKYRAKESLDKVKEEVSDERIKAKLDAARRELEETSLPKREKALKIEGQPAKKEKEPTKESKALPAPEKKPLTLELELEVVPQQK